MTQLKLCQDCKWSTPEKNSEWNNRCYHPLVVAHDAWALAQNREGEKRGYGVCCHEERKKGWLRGQCGMRGALYEVK